MWDTLRLFILRVPNWVVCIQKTFFFSPAIFDAINVFNVYLIGLGIQYNFFTFPVIYTDNRRICRYISKTYYEFFSGYAIYILKSVFLYMLICVSIYILYFTTLFYCLGQLVVLIWTLVGSYICSSLLSNNAFAVVLFIFWLHTYT